MRVFNQPIPADKMGLFHEILRSTGGYYLSNPRQVGMEFRVDYAPGDVEEQQKRWAQCTTAVLEVRRDQRWRRLLRRLRFW